MRPDNPPLEGRDGLLLWLLPLSLAVAGVAYQLGLAPWLRANIDDVYEHATALLFHVAIVPLLTFWALTRFGLGLDDRRLGKPTARAEQEQLATIAAKSADAIIGLDPQGAIQSWNQGAEHLLGHAAGQMQHRPLSDLLGGSPAAEVESRWLHDYLQQNGFLRGHETSCLTAHGDRMAVELTATRLMHGAGQYGGTSIILRDITQRRQREEGMRQRNIQLQEQMVARTQELSEKVEQLGRANLELQELDRTRSEFVSLVSHQLRAPLTNICGAVERIEASCPIASASCSRLLNIINQQADRLDRLVRDVLNVTRVETGELMLHAEPLSVLPIVEQVVEQIGARTPGRSILLPDKPGFPLVYADRTRLVEVLINLLDNADKYSPPGQEIAVDLRADEVEVTVSVRDRGPGVPAGETERVFDKFHRTDSSDSQVAYGYGLGLYVCRLLVEAQGGRIWVENYPQGGAIFSFTLPVAKT